jgi:hypothetical protein
VVGIHNLPFFMFLADEPANLRTCFGHLEGLQRDFEDEISRTREAQSNVPSEYLPSRSLRLLRSSCAKF